MLIRLNVFIDDNTYSWIRSRLASMDWTTTATKDDRSLKLFHHHYPGPTLGMSKCSDWFAKYWLNSSTFSLYDLLAERFIFASSCQPSINRKNEQTNKQHKSEPIEQTKKTKTVAERSTLCQEWSFLTYPLLSNNFKPPLCISHLAFLLLPRIILSITLIHVLFLLS